MTTSTTTLQVTFVSASAAYQNTFGWYDSATGLGGIIFSDATTLTTGATATFNVPTADLSDVQFFLISDGYDDNSHSAVTGPIKVIQLSDGTWAVAKTDSQGNVLYDHGQPEILDGTGVNALFTQTSKNAGGVDYAASVAGSNQTSATLAGDTADGATGTIAWEDLAATKNKNGTYSKPGDADYNDAVFSVSIYHAPPVAKNDANTISEDAGSTALNVLANDSDPNAGATFSVTSVHTSGLLGTVTIAANGQSITYNPGSAFQYLAVGEKATETFTYTITDSFGGTSTATETVTITGVNDAPTIASANAAATITEIADNASGENTATRSASGAISFNDADISDNHTVSSTAVGTGYLGTFTATLSADANNNGDCDPDNPSPGSVTWNFSVKDSALDYLSAGQTLTQKYNVVISDGHGGTTTQVVTVTLVGTNDAPTISAAATTGGVTELPDGSAGENTATLTSSGTISFNDVDLADVHTTSVTAGGSGYFGTLTAAVTNNSTGDGAGTVTWTFSVSDGAIDFLSAGQKLIQTYTVAIDDGHGGTVSKNITITITGAADATNRAPVAVADIAGVTEDVTLTATGNVLTNDTDPDAGDTHSVTAVNGSAGNVGAGVGGTYGTLSLGSNGNYTYTLANGQTNVQALTQGQVVTDVFTYTNSDNHGGSSSSTLTISVTGTNDVAVIGGSHAGSVTEDVGGSGGNLSTGGTLTVSDADAGQSSFTAQGGAAGSNGYGTFTLAANGAWTYSAADGQSAIQQLGAGQTITDSFTAVSSDGSASQIVTVTISGTNDVAIIGGVTTGSVTEDVGVDGSNNIATSGMLTVSDADAGQSSFTAQGGKTGSNGYGTFTLAANGAWTYSASDGQSAIQHLGAGQTITDSFTAVSSDGSASQVVTVTISGTNDAPVAIADTNTGDAVVESGVAVGGNTPFAGDPSAAGNVLTNDTEVDNGDTHSVTAVNGNAGNVGVAIGGTYGTLTLNAGGGYTYALNNALAATNALAQGEMQSDVFTYTDSDNHGGSSTTTLSIVVTGTNDVPVITGGTTTGHVTEDASTTTATGAITVVDPDHSAQQFWTVVGGTPSGSANYHFRMDTLTITKGGSPFFTDDFGDGNPPPSAPANTVANGYGGVGAFTESGGKLNLDSNNAGSFVGVGTPDPIIGEDAVLRTNITPSTTNGLRLSTTFDVTGVFDLIMPNSPRQEYGIRLMDRLIGGTGTPPDQQGDDTISLTVRENLSGNVVVSLRDIDFQNDVTTNIQSIPLVVPTGADQIALHLNHDVAGSHVLTASFDYLQAGMVIGTQTFTATPPIFNNEDWTRADIVADAPAVNDSTLGGTYGTLDIGQSGAWTYTLNNASGATQALAQGQTATDTFNVQVADQYGASSSTPITITVTGSNDAPVMQTGPVFRGLTEDLNADANNKITATGFSQFGDVDLTDTHTISTALQSSSIGIIGGGPGTPPAMPASLTALLPGALTAVLTDPATGDGHGQLQWNFSLDNSQLQFLAAGQEVTLNYKVNVTDTFGATTSQTITVVINGNNDTPVVATAGTDTTGSVTESPAGVETTHQITGQVAFTDADQTDVHTAVGFIPSGSHYGNLSATIAPGSDSTGGVTGSATWTYTVNDSSLDFLAQGQQVTDTQDVLIADAWGGIAQQAVTITLTGSNDTPIMVPGTQNFSFTEDSAPLFTAGESSDFRDVDVTDTHTVTTALQSATLSSGATLPAGLSAEIAAGLTATFVRDDTPFVDGEFDWNFSLDNNQFQFLAQSEVLNIVYRLDVHDPFGGVAGQLVNVAITGTNDAPIITTPEGSTTITGPSSVPIFFDNFDEEAGGHGGQLIENYTAFQNWNVTRGTVDLYWEPNGIENVFPGNGGYVDLGGLPGTDFGALTSKTTYGPGTYELSFDIGGTGRIPIYHNNPDGVNVTFGSYTENFMPGDSQILHVTREVTLTSSSQLTIADLGLSGGSAIGATLFDVAITQENVTGSVAAVASQTTLTTSGTFAFTDVDLIDTHSTSVTAAAGDIGTLTAHVSMDTTGTGTGGIVTWDYQVDEAAAAALTTTAIDTFTVTVADDAGGTSQEVIRVAVLPPTHVNQAPVAVADAASVVESGVNPGNTPFAGTPTATGNVLNNDSDIDGGTHKVTAVNGDVGNVDNVVNGTYGMLAIGSNGSYAYSLDNSRAATNALARGQVVTEVFNYTNTDNGGLSSTATLTINVTGTNDAPIANVDTNAGDPVVAGGLKPGNNAFGGDAFASGNVLANDTDVDGGDTQTITDVNGNTANVGTPVSGIFGSLTLNSDGSWSYGLDFTNAATVALGQDQVATEVFTYTDTDNNGASSSSTLTISVTGTNDGPVAVADTNAGDPVVEAGVNPGNTPFAGDPTASGNVLANDTDADIGDTHTVSAVGGDPTKVGFTVSGIYGSVVINSDGSYIYTLINANPATQGLAQGATGTDVFVYTVSDSHGATNSTSLSITVTGTNDAPIANMDFNAVVESGVVVVSGVTTPFAGTPSATGNVLANDPDDDTDRVSAVNGSVSNVGTAVNGAYGTLTLNANGSYTYALNNALAATDALAQGEIQTEVFAYTNTDPYGASSASTLNIAVTGTNDAPAITGGALIGNVTEDSGTSTTTGTITVTDPDHNATKTWTVVGGTPSSAANYHFLMDSFTVNNPGNIPAGTFTDTFTQSIPTPTLVTALPVPASEAGSYGGTYAGIGSFTETGNKLHLDSSNAVSFVGVGNPDPVIGEDAIVKTNINPVNPGTPNAGLKKADTFSVTGVFDLILPNAPRQEYGIRLTNRLVGGTGTPPDQLGDDVISLTVGEAANGAIGVVLKDVNFATNTLTVFQKIALAPPTGTTEIALHLNHAANATVATASFDYLNSSGATLQTVNFTATGAMFGTGPGASLTDSNGNPENWVRAEIVADSPAVNDSTLGGTYGNLDINQSGLWTYTLNNALPATQALAQNQVAQDTFSVQVADQFGAASTTTVTVNVTGTNDAPIMQTASVSRSLTEGAGLDGSGNLTATGLAQFSDADLTNVHVTSATLQSAVLSDGSSLSPGLATALANAMSTFIDDAATGDGHGELAWNFSLSNSAVQFLTTGETLTLDYHVNVADPSNATATQDVSITITGTAADNTPTNYTFSTLTEPGNNNVDRLVINDPGQAAGDYADPSVGGSTSFEYSNGVSTPIGVPLALYTQAWDINNEGQITGSYDNGDTSNVLTYGHVQGFMYDNGTYSSIQIPPAHVANYFVYPLAINDAGQVIGYYDDTSSGTIYGFLSSNGTFTTIGSGNEGPQDINDSGQIAGTSTGVGGNSVGFVYNNGSYSFLTAPDATNTNVKVINNAGDVGGWSGNDGFLYSNGVFTTVSDPLATQGTLVQAINDSGQVAGTYTTAGGQYGFVYSNGNYTTIDPAGSSHVEVNAINDSGQVSGIYKDASGKSVGFIATPQGTSVTVKADLAAELNSSSPATVSFAASTGTLQLDQSQSFAGTIAGFGGQDQIDLRDIAFGANTTLGYTPNANNTGGTLAVSDTAHTANLALLGQYTAASFAKASDGQGGTTITDPPAQDSNLLTSPHA